jgi:hypothetical protein
MLVSGHLAPTWSNKSYFTESVSQGLLDEVISRKTTSDDRGHRQIIYAQDMGRVIGYSPTGPNLWEPRRDVTVIVQKANCYSRYLSGWRSRNEVVTMYPGRPTLEP